MAYEQKPGGGSAFKNKYKKESKHPDYKGTYKHIDGKDYDVAVWIKKDRNGDEFISFMTSEPRPKQDNIPDWAK